MKQATMLILAGLMLWGTSLQAQDPCQGYERDLELYFQVYQPGEPPALSWMDRAWRECRQPSLRLELLYHYFKAMESLYSQSGVTEVGYRMADFHYQRIEQNLPFLQNSRAARDNFVVLFGRRSDALNKTLQAQAQVLASASRLPDPAAGQEAFTWIKETPDFDPQPTTSFGPNSRGQNNPATEFQYSKSSPSRDIYQQTADDWRNRRATVPPQASFNDNPYQERYGVVGNLNQLNMRDYMVFRGQNRSNSPQVAMVSRGGDLMGQPRGAEPAVAQVSRSLPQNEVLTYASATTGTTRSLVRNAPGAWVDRLSGAYQQAANLYTPLTVRDQPSFTGATVDKVEFGEIVALDGSSQTVMAVGMPFVHIRTQSGKEGWVEKLALIEGGRLAVTTQAVQGFSKPSSDSRRLGLDMAEPVVLAETQGNWVKVFNLNGEKEIWLPSISNLSIEPIDLAVAEGLLEAKKMPTPDRARAILQDLRKLGGYQGSALAPLVEQRLR